MTDLGIGSRCFLCRSREGTLRKRIEVSGEYVWMRVCGDCLTHRPWRGRAVQKAKRRKPA